MKPRFKRSEYFRYRRLKQSWRKPRGKHNKMRNYLGGKMLSPCIGYGTKAELRGLHPSGMREALVENLAQLGSVDAKTQAVRIASGVGKRKRSEILALAKKLKLTVLNPGVEKLKKAAKKPEEKAKKVEAKEKPKVEKKQKKAAQKKAEKKPAKKESKKQV